MRRKINIVFSVFLWKLCLIGIVVIGAPLLRPIIFFFPEITYREWHMPDWIWVWGNFDGLHYLHIASLGYRPGEQPFLPLYPALIALGYRVFHLDYIVSGQLISLVSFVVALFIVRKLLALDAPKISPSVFIALILIFPTSFYYSAVYNDALFFFLSTLSIYLGRRQKWIWSIVIASVASITRINGLMLFLYICTEYAWSSVPLPEQWRVASLKKYIFERIRLRHFLRDGMYAILLIPASFIGYLIYIDQRFGSWKFVFSSMKVWNQEKIVIPLQVAWRYAKIIFIASPDTYVYWIAVVELSFVIFYTFLILYFFRKIRVSYWIFFVSSMLLPSLTGTFQGMPRYGLHLYPFFLCLGLWFHALGSNKKILYVSLSAIGLIAFVILFIHGYFVA